MNRATIVGFQLEKLIKVRNIAEKIFESYNKAATSRSTPRRFAYQKQSLKTSIAAYN
jgi:hypothetical protein